MKDEIISEVWRVRDSLAEKYGHDLGAIVAAMRERERHPLTAIRRRGTRGRSGATARRRAAVAAGD